MECGVSLDATSGSDTVDVAFSGADLTAWLGLLPVGHGRGHCPWAWLEAGHRRGSRIPAQSADTLMSVGPPSHILRQHSSRELAAGS